MVETQLTTDTEILQIVSQMPENLKQELLHYAKYLMENYSENINDASSEIEKPKKRNGFGILKGKIWMSDDFDEPLEDLKDYM